VSTNTPRIDPATKSWIDYVLVPALVDQYLAKTRDVGDNDPDRYPPRDTGKETIQ
jgi:hypothetical protein